MILSIKFSSRKTMQGSPWSVGAVKGNVRHVTGHEGADGDLRCNCTLSLISALDRVRG